MKLIKYLCFSIGISLTFSHYANAQDGYYQYGQDEFYSCDGEVYSKKLFNDLVKNKILPDEFVSKLNSSNKIFGTTSSSQFGVASDNKVILINHISGCFKSSSSFIVYEKALEKDSNNWHLEVTNHGDLPLFSGNSFREAIESACLKLK